MTRQIIDWQKLCLDLRGRGYSMRKLSTDLGMHLDYMGQLSRCEIQEPRYSAGVELIRLHQEELGNEKTMMLFFK